MLHRFARPPILLALVVGACGTTPAPTPPAAAPSAAARAAASAAAPTPTWHWENAAPTRWPIHALWRADGVVLAVGEHGAIVRSTDDGATWTTLPAGTEADLDRFERVGADDVYALGPRGGALSNDGGKTFAPLRLGPERELTTFFAPRPDDVRIALCATPSLHAQPPSGPFDGAIVRSTDRGRTFVAEPGSRGDCWVTIAELGAAGLFAGGAGGTILRHAGGTGWVEENGTAIRDGNYAATLTALGVDAKGPYARAEYSVRMRIAGHRTVTLVLRRTEQGGHAQWVRSAEPPDPLPEPRDRRAVPELVERVATGVGSFEWTWDRAPGDRVGVGGPGFGRSHDGGLTWSLQATCPQFKGIVRAGPRAVAVDYLGALFRTADAGRTWSIVMKHAWPNQPFTAVFAIGPSPEQFFIGGMWNGHGLIGTSDGGGTWDVEPISPSVRPISTLISLPGGELYGGGVTNFDRHAVGVVLHRPAGGSSSEQHVVELPNPGGGVAFGVTGLWASSADDVWASDSAGELLRTRDHGRTWTVTPAGPGPLLAVGGAGPDDIYAVGEVGAIVRVRDGGRKLDARPSPVRESLRAVWAGGEVVYVIGGAGAVLRSRDRGETFERVLDAGVPLNALAADGPNDVWIVGDRGVILHLY